MSSASAPPSTTLRAPALASAPHGLDPKNEGGGHPAAAAAVLDPPRLAALEATGLLGGAPSAAFDRATQLVRDVLGVPVALVSLVAADRQVFASHRGLAEPWASRGQTPLSHSFCQHVVAADAPFAVADAGGHPLVCDNLAIADLDVRAYLGHPIHDLDGATLGSLCAIDSAPREWTERDRTALGAIAATVEAEVALRAEVDRRRAAEGLARTEALALATVLANLNDVVFQTDADGRYTYLNETWVELTGHAVEDALGRHCLDFLASGHDEVAEEIRAKTQSVAPGSVERFRSRFAVRHADGSVRHFQSHWRPAFDADGTPTGWAGTYTDVTDTILYHAERAARLEAERARDEAERARDEAERMARLQRAFLSNLSHEIRTPLTAILGGADILVSEAPGDLREFAATVLSGGRRLLGMLNGLLDLARAEAGSVEVTHRDVDVAEAVRASVDEIRALAERKGLAVSVDVAAGLPPVTLDGALFGRVVGALLDNAVKFTDSGCVAVRVRYDGEALAVHVSDTGLGVAPEVLPHVFDAFSQGSDGDGRTHEGAGIGLALVRQLTESLGGTLAVASDVGAGSTFSVRVPAPAVETS